MSVVPTVRRPIADRRRTHGDRTIQSAIGRRPLQVFVVSATDRHLPCKVPIVLLHFFVQFNGNKSSDISTPHYGVEKGGIHIRFFFFSFPEKGAAGRPDNRTYFSHSTFRR